MAIFFRKPGDVVSVPAGFAAVMITIPVAALDQATATAKKIASLNLASAQFGDAMLALSKTDAELDADVVAFQARVDQLKALRGSGSLS